jgi:hypothetical protein
MNCLQCGAGLPADGRRDQKYCGRSCSGKAYYHRGKAGLPPRPPRRHPALESDNPVLVAAAIYARELGAAHDWSGEITNRCLDALVTLMAGRWTGDRVPLTEVRTRPHRLASRRRLVEILSHFGLLEDDTESPIRAWIDRVTAELPPGFAEPSHHWLLTLLLGDARSRPRSPTTLYNYFGAVRPPSRTLVHLLRPSQGGHQGRCRRGAAAVSGKPAPQSDQGAAVAVPTRQEEWSGLRQPDSRFEEPPRRPGSPAHHR